MTQNIKEQINYNFCKLTNEVLEIRKELEYTGKSRLGNEN